MPPAASQKSTETIQWASWVRHRQDPASEAAATKELRPSPQAGPLPIGYGHPRQFPFLSLLGTESCGHRVAGKDWDLLSYL